MLAISTKRTCLPFKQRHWCNTHKKFSDKKHLVNCDQFKLSVASLKLIDLLKTTPINVLNKALRKDIIDTFNLLNMEVKEEIEFR